MHFVCRCLLVPVHPALERQILGFAWGTKESSGGGGGWDYFWADSDNKNSTERFYLAFLVTNTKSLNLVHSKSAPPVWAALSFKPRRSSLETEGDENHFSFPLLRLIHSFHCGKSSKMHVQHELPFIWSYLQSVALPPEMTCCSAPLQPRGSARNLISCMTLWRGPNVIKRQHRSRFNEQVNEGNEWECFTLKSLINLASRQLLLLCHTFVATSHRHFLCWLPGATYPQALISWGN